MKTKPYRKEGIYAPRHIETLSEYAGQYIGQILLFTASGVMEDGSNGGQEMYVAYTDDYGNAAKTGLVPEEDIQWSGFKTRAMLREEYRIEYEAKRAQMEAILKPRLTAEWLEVLVLAIRTIAPSDMHEVGGFIDECFVIAGKEPPANEELEPFI